MTIVVSMSGSFIFKVLFMIVSLSILVSSWFRVSYFTGKLSKIIIDKILLLIPIDVHVCNWRVVFFNYLSSCWLSPVGLYSFHVPLVHNCYYFITCTILIKVSENSLVPLVDQHFLLFRSHSIEHVNNVVNSESINGFSKGLSASCMESAIEIMVFASSGSEHACKFTTSPQSSMGIHIWLRFQCFDGELVKLLSSVYDVSTSTFSLFQCEFGL